MLSAIVLHLINFLGAAFAVVCVIVGGMIVGTNVGFLVRDQLEEFDSSSLMFGAIAVLVFGLYFRYITRHTSSKYRNSQAAGLWIGIITVVLGVIYLGLRA